MKRLSEASLGQINPATVKLPGYDRSQVRIGIVHLGIGAFHRAHQALYTEQVLDDYGGDWGICGVSLRRANVREQMQPQDGLYTSLEKFDGTSRVQVVGAVREVLVAPEDPEAVFARIADPAVKVVTLTVTEKAYCLKPDGELDETHPDIIHDLAHAGQPRSAAAYLLEGIRRRRRQNGGPLTVISCDNLSGNGRKLRRVVLALVPHPDEGLAQWIEEHCSFPDTMVDKIVPATTEQGLLEVEKTLGYRDEAAVIGEPFRQWVIESDFAAPVPAWDRVGALFVEEVAPFETMKLRLLNASHSTIAYLGCLAGWDTVAEAVSHPELKELVGHVMRVEIQPGLEIPEGFDVQAYQAQLLERFANQALHHSTRQIAMDGSQKLPQRLLPALQWQLDRDGPYEVLCLGLAAWILHCMEPGLDDPLEADIDAIRQSAGEDLENFMHAMLGLEQVFPPAMKEHGGLCARLLSLLRALQERGAAAVIADCASRVAASC